MVCEHYLHSIRCIQRHILPLCCRHTNRSLIFSSCLFFLGLYSRINTPARHSIVSFFPHYQQISQGRNLRKLDFLFFPFLSCSCLTSAVVSREARVLLQRRQKLKTFWFSFLCFLQCACSVAAEGSQRCKVKCFKCVNVVAARPEGIW